MAENLPGHQQPQHQGDCCSTAIDAIDYPFTARSQAGETGNYVVTPEVSLGESLAANCLPISLALVLVGLFVMITRKKAIAQMMGLMLMENGLFLVAIAITSGMPLVVELGIFFDLFLGVLIMGILAFRINRTFDSINVNRLQKLKG